MQQVWWARSLRLSVAVLLMVQRRAWASTGGRMPLQTFFAELYAAGIGTYIPILALVIVITSVLNWHYGWVSIGEGLGKLILSVAILAGGVALIVGWVGGTIAEGAALP